MECAINSRKEIFKGKVFTVEQLQVQLPNGRTSLYELISHPGAVTIIPIDNEGNMLFVSQFRVGAEKALLELPAGTLSYNEEPLHCASREIREETGMAASEMQELGSFYLAPGYSSEYMHIFLATGLYPSPLPGDEDEFLELVTIPVAEVYQMAYSGKIEDGKTLAALLLARNWLYDKKHLNK